MSLVGAVVKRKEDPSLLVGRRWFVDDIGPAGTLFAKLVRSTEAHALLASIDTSAAAAVPGVYKVLTGEDMADLSATANLPEEVAPLRRWPTRWSTHSRASASGISTCRITPKWCGMR